MPDRERPDELENPVPHDAPSKSVVDSVLSGLISAGNSVVSLVAGLLAAVLVLYSGYVIYDSFNTQYKAYSSAWDLLQYKPEYIDDYEVPLSGSTLREINEDYRAWLTVYDSTIDYPVVQGPNDLYYANHDIYKNSSLTGAIYLATANTPDLSDSYNLVYGHHMDNGAMFGCLDSFKDQSYFNAHREGIIVGESGAYDIQLFAVVSTDAYENRIYGVGDRAQEVLSFLESGGEGGVGLGTQVLIYDAEVAKTAERMIALSTCASASTNGRLVVIGKMTKRDLIDLTVVNEDGNPADNDDNTFTWEYDGEDHHVTGIPSLEDATVEYSTDGGETWTDVPPTIKDTGDITVTIRATTPANGTVTVTATLRVTRRTVTVQANDATKVYNTADPVFTAIVTGTLNGDTVQYTVENRAPSGNVGEYPGALTPTGQDVQGNYTVVYLPGTLTITRAQIPLNVTGYTGRADGQPHGVTVNTNILPQGTTLEYSTDGGVTWTTTPPTLTEAGSLTVTVRATNPNYETATATAVITLEPAIPTYTLVIRYMWNDEEAAPAKTYTYAEGTRYSVPSPTLVGYSTDMPLVSGVLTQDTEITVVYTRKAYRLTVRYVDLNGVELAAAYTEELFAGEVYSVGVPEIAGYTAARQMVTGVMGSRDEVITVIYVPMDDPVLQETVTLIGIDEYETPLGLDHVNMQVGVCWE